MNDPQKDGSTEPAEQPEQPEHTEEHTMNRAERRHAGKHGANMQPGTFQKGAAGGSIHGPHSPVAPQHKKGTIPRKKGM